MQREARRGIDEEVGWVDVTVIHHQRLAREVDLKMRGHTRTVV